MKAQLKLNNVDECGSAICCHPNVTCFWEGPSNLKKDGATLSACMRAAYFKEVLNWLTCNPDNAVNWNQLWHYTMNTMNAMNKREKKEKKDKERHVAKLCKHHLQRLSCFKEKERKKFLHGFSVTFNYYNLKIIKNISFWVQWT